MGERAPSGERQAWVPPNQVAIVTILARRLRGKSSIDKPSRGPGMSLAGNHQVSRPIERMEVLSRQTDAVLIAANPRAGAGSSAVVIEKLVAAVREHGLHAEVYTNLDDITSAAAQMLSRGRLRAVVAAGGDGTLQELVNRTTSETPLAVFPLGTANLMANYLGLRPDPQKFATMLAAGQAIRFDAARANWLPPENADSPQLPASRVFLVMAGIGFDATVVERLHRERAEHRTGHINYLSYIKPIVGSLRTYPYPSLRYECAPEAGPGLDGDTGAAGPWQSFSARWLFVHNLPRYAVGLNFAPRALGTDGLMDVCAFERGSFWDGLRYLSQVWLGRHELLPDCRILRTRRLRITCDQPVAVQLDGDPGGHTPFEIEMLPARARLLVPSAALAQLDEAQPHGGIERQLASGASPA
jgi:diacylglycerol kinase (ATP)